MEGETPAPAGPGIIQTVGDDPSRTEWPLALRRWPKWTWPLVFLVRDTPWTLALLAVIWISFSATRLLGLPYFRSVPPEQAAACQLALYALAILFLAGRRTGTRGVAWGKSSLRMSAAQFWVYLSPLVFAFWLVAEALRHSGAFLILLALTELGVHLAAPPEPLLLKSAAIWTLVLWPAAIGLFMVGIRMLWRIRHFGRPAARALGWVVAGGAASCLAIHAHHEESRFREMRQLIDGTSDRVRKIDLLGEALRSGPDRLRQSACRDLYELGGEARPAVPALIGALGSRSREVRYAAAAALGGIGDPSAIPALVEASRRRESFFGVQDLSEGVRWRISDALSKMGPGRIAPYLDDADPAVRATVLESFTRGDNPRHVPIDRLLRSCTSDDREESRQAFIILQSRSERPDSIIPALIERLPRASPDHKRSIAWFFRECGPRAAAATGVLIEWLFAPDPSLQYSAAEALVAIGPVAYEALQKARLERREEDLPRLAEVLVLIPRPIPPPPPPPGPKVEAEPQLPPRVEAGPTYSLQVRLEHDSRPLSELTPVVPEVSVYDPASGKWLAGVAGETPSLFLVKGVSAGTVTVRASLKSETGDYSGAKTATVVDGPNPVIDLELSRRIRLLEPPEGTMLQESLPLLPLPARFRWESLGEGVDYRLSFRGTLLPVYQDFTTRETSFVYDGNPGPYELNLTALRGKKVIGHITFTYRARFQMRGQEVVRDIPGTAFRFRMMPAEAAPSTVAMKLMHDGRDFDPGPAPTTVTVKDLTRGQSPAPPGRDGAKLQIEGLLPGVYEVTVSVDADRSNPPGYSGDYTGTLKFGLRQDSNPERLMHLTRILRLLKPEDTARPVLAQRGKGGPPAFRSPVEFEWEGLGEDVQYTYTLSGGAYSNGSTRETRLLLDVHPGQGGENFRLQAHRKGRLVGELFIGGEKKTYHFFALDRER